MGKICNGCQTLNSIDNLSYQHWQNFVGDILVLHGEILFSYVLCAKNLFPPQAATIERKRLYVAVFNLQT